MLTLSVVATKGGVGKTTLCANIGGLLADMGYRVLLIDADIQPALTPSACRRVGTWQAP
ncbi:MAG: ParA family protein [Hydrogenophaga sp.]|nr:ParA family protein [Hydrogenophaga sp.]